MVLNAAIVDKLAAPGKSKVLQENGGMSSLRHLRIKMYRTVARQLHGVVPCWVCGEHVAPDAATLEHIQALSDGGNSHADNLAISHEACNGQRHAAGRVPLSLASPGRVQRRLAGEISYENSSIGP